MVTHFGIHKCTWKSVINDSYYPESIISTLNGPRSLRDVFCTLVIRGNRSSISSRITTNSSSNIHVCDGSKSMSSQGETNMSNIYSIYYMR